MQLQKSVAQLPKAKETKERIDQYWKGNGVEVKEFVDLDYSPQYSEEQLEKVIAEVVKNEPDKAAGISVPQTEFIASNYEEGNRKILDKSVPVSGDPSSKSQKNGLFGGLFGRKK